ncbi:MAG: hypothetical protein Q7U47_12140 [Paludibacter sp.]|nr:hypothetical protein [Paludibacter sp.]
MNKINSILNAIKVFISKTCYVLYNQHELPGGYLILTNPPTNKKKRQLEEISQKLGLELKVEVV